MQMFHSIHGNKDENHQQFPRQFGTKPIKSQNSLWIVPASSW